MCYRQLAASGCATPPKSLGSVEPVLSVADVSSVVEVLVSVELVSSVELVAGVATEFAELSSVPAAEGSVVALGSVAGVEEVSAGVVAVVAVTGVAAVLCEVSSARASPGMARANAVARATIAGTIQPWTRFRCKRVMAFRSFDEGSIHDLHSGRSPSTNPCRQPREKLERRRSDSVVTTDRCQRVNVSLPTV
ncbi:MAG TPA: hypothetical protein VGL69_11510 [Solirubrobacteraceae bacterium]|jgi:hypothetical protein